MGLFGKKPPADPRVKGREISSELRKQGRLLDRQINQITREMNKVKITLKTAAKKGDKATCNILAKEVVNAKKAINRIYASKAQINSVDMTLKNQISMARVSGAFEKSTEVMKSMQSLVKVSEVQETMMSLSKEMMKMGIMEEMMEDSFDNVTEEEEMEEAAQDEIDKVLYEITAGALGKMPDTEQGALPEVSNPEVATEESEDEDEDIMVQRLAALRS